MGDAAKHLSDQQIERYRRRSMSPAELLASDDHLALCDACHSRLQNEAELRATLSSVAGAFVVPARPEPEHPAYEKLAAYVDDRLTGVEREVLEAHLEFCGPCERELHGLRSVQAALASEPARKPAPAAWLARAAYAHKLFTFWKLPAYRTLVPVAAAIAFAAVLVGLATFSQSLRKQVADLRFQVARLQQRNEALERQVAEAGDLRTQLGQLSREPGRLRPGPEKVTSGVLALNDAGRQVLLGAQGDLSGLQFSNPSHQQAVLTALITQRIARPAGIEELVAAPGQLMGGAEDAASFRLLSPVGTTVVSNRPTFRWSPLSGASAYMVAVYDPSFREVAASPSLSGTEWTVASPLRRGRVYRWQVRTVVGEKEIVSPARTAPEARFKVLDEKRAEEVAGWKQTYAGSHLTLGILYAGAGMLDGAERELQALLRANPGSPVARKLLQDVKSLRHK